MAIDIDAVWNDALNIAGEILAAHLARKEEEPAKTRRTRYREALALLPPVRPDDWQEPAGTYDPADMDETIAAAMLTVARVYVKRHSSSVDPSRPTYLHGLAMQEDDQDEAVARILAHVYTRDYEGSGIGKGNHARAFWQSAALHRRTGWRGYDAVARKQARRAAKAVDLDATHRSGAQGCRFGDPAALVAAAEQAEKAIRWTPQRRRGKTRVALRDRGSRKAGTATYAEAMAVLRPAEHAARYAGPAPLPKAIARRLARTTTEERAPDCWRAGVEDGPFRAALGWFADEHSATLAAARVAEQRDPGGDRAVAWVEHTAR